MKLITTFLAAFVTMSLISSAYAQTTPAPAASPPTPAADAPAKVLTPQQQKFSACSKDAKSKNLKGDDKKTFMSTCLKGTAASSAPSAPATATAADTDAAKAAADKKAKRKACSTQAKTQNLTGDDRKKFMTTCMQG